MKKLDKYLYRPKSILTGKENLEPLYTLKDFPVFMGCVNTPQDEDIMADMEWVIDPETGIIQLAKLIPLEILYLGQHNEGLGKIWQDHYQEFCNFLKKFDPKNVLEIGGANGHVAESFTNTSPQTKWTIIEPNPTFDGNSQIKVIKGWFDEHFTTDLPIDTIVHSHVLEHTLNPSAFMENMAKFLKPGQKQIFTFPNLYHFLKQKFTNGLNFEHTLFITEYFADWLLEKNGFQILEKQYFLDHSIFYATKKTKIPTNSPNLENKYKEYKKLFLGFVRYHLEMISDINIKMSKSNLPVYLFGAHIFSQFLIAFGLNTKKIVTILDNGPAKQRQRLYGTRFIIQSPKILKNLGQINLILKAGHYNEEIKKDILENINDQVTFW